MDIQSDRWIQKVSLDTKIRDKIWNVSFIVISFSLQLRSNCENTNWAVDTRYWFLKIFGSNYMSLLGKITKISQCKMQRCDTDPSSIDQTITWNLMEKKKKKESDYVARYARAIEILAFTKYNDGDWYTVVILQRINASLSAIIIVSHVYPWISPRSRD